MEGPLNRCDRADSRAAAATGAVLRLASGSVQAILGQLQPRDNTSVVTVEPAGATPRGNSESPPAKAEQGTPSVVQQPTQQPSPTPPRQQAGPGSHGIANGGSFGEKDSVATGALRDKGSTLAGAPPPPASCYLLSFLGTEVACHPTVWWRRKLPVNLVPAASEPITSPFIHVAGNQGRPCLWMTLGLLQCSRHLCWPQ